MKHTRIGCALTVALLFTHGVRTEAQPTLDPVKLQGKTLNKVHPDDVKLLGVVARGALFQAQAGERLTLEQSRVSLAALRAYRNQDHDEAYRFVTRFLLLRRGEKITEATELAAALDFQLDRKLLASGDPLHALLTPLFDLGAPLSAEYSVRLRLKNPDGRTTTLDPVTIKDLKDRKIALPTRDLKPGRYVVEYELRSSADKALVSCSREFLVHADAGQRTVELSQRLGKLNREKIADRGIHHLAALETAEYVVEILTRAGKEYVAPMLKRCNPMTTKLRGLELSNYDSEPFDLDRDLPLAEQFVAALEAGKDPLTGRTGDLRLAHRSGVDNTLQPFRVYLPTKYDPKKPMPLIVALHGATGDESTYLDRYISGPKREKLFSKLAEERGYLLATPNGRGAFGMYQGDSEKDVLEVLERMKKLFAVNPKQVFLTGHSMGAQGTWVLGFKHPDLFTALAPIAGRPQELDGIAFQNAPDKPVFFAAGLKDVLQPPIATRQLADRAKKELKRFQYKEYNDDHFRIGVTSMPDVFDFFDAHRSLGRANAFRLNDAQGGTRTLKDWANARVVVLVFLGAECPLSNQYAPDLQEMLKDWSKRGVVLEGVYSDPDATAESATAHAKEYGLTFPLLLDPEQTVARSLGIRVTPEAVVLSPDGDILYRGRIDDRYTADGIREDGPQVHDLKAAVEAVLSGKTPPNAEVRAFGCPLPRREKSR